MNIKEAIDSFMERNFPYVLFSMCGLMLVILSFIIAHEEREAQKNGAVCRCCKRPFQKSNDQLYIDKH